MALIGEYGLNEGSGSTTANTLGGTTAVPPGNWVIPGHGGSAAAVKTTSTTDAITIYPFSVSGSAFTFMCWFRIDASSGGYQTIMYGPPDATGYLEVSSSLEIDWYNSDGGLLSGPIVVVGDWHHIAISADGTTRTLFVDGVEASSVASSLLHSNESVSFGGGDGGQVTRDDLRTFDSALPEAEVATWMNTIIGGSGQDYAAAGTVATASGVTGALTRDPAEFPVGGTASTVSSVAGSVSVTVDYRFITGTSGRAFIDQDGQPILVKGDSPWSAPVDLSTPEWSTWCQNRESYGFNAAIVSLLGAKENGGPSNDGATFDGILPFGTGFTPNETYWARFDQFVQIAASHGITLFMFPIDGWVVKVGNVVRDMTVAQAETYGAWVASRYSSSPNVQWMLGGDYLPTATDREDVMQAVLTGIRAVDQRPFALHGMYQRSWSRQWSNWAPRCEWDFVYSRLPAYEALRLAHAQTPHVPTMFGEGIYDGMYSGTAAQSNLVCRMQVGYALSSGATGDFFGTADWEFNTGWEGRLDSATVSAVQAMRATVEAEKWWELEPAPNFIQSGGGTPYVFPNEPDPGEDPSWGNLTDSNAPSSAAIPGTMHTHDYASAAVAPDGSLAVVYMPSSRQITLDQGELGAEPSGVWVNPSSGAESPASVEALTPPSSGDWLLVLQATPVASVSGRVDSVTGVSGSVTSSQSAAAAVTVDSGVSGAVVATLGARGEVAASAATQGSVTVNEHTDDWEVSGLVATVSNVSGALARSPRDWSSQGIVATDSALAGALVASLLLAGILKSATAVQGSATVDRGADDRPVSGLVESASSVHGTVTRSAREWSVAGIVAAHTDVVGTVGGSARIIPENLTLVGAGRDLTLIATIERES